MRDSNIAKPLTVPDENSRVSFDILCGVPSVGLAFTRNLKEQGFRFDPNASVKLVIDIQRGFALHILETLDRTNLRLVVITFNFCPAYWDDLWDLHPDVLIVDAGYEHDFADALRRAYIGEQYRVVPKSKTNLNRMERRVLSRLATGLSNKEIAKQVALEEKTVMNILTNLYKELGSTNRIQAALYYWGIWHKADSDDKNA